MPQLIFIAIGGAIGAMLRYGIAVATKLWLPLGNGFPLGTFFANLIGAFLMGILFAFFQRSGISDGVKVMLTTGFLGALTTFSTFALETVNLMRSGEVAVALLYLALSNLLGLLLVWIGMQLGGTL